jgi:hypothetical protein
LPVLLDRGDVCGGLDTDVLGEFAAFVEDMFAAFLVVLVLCDGTGMAMFAACGDGGECD